MIEVNKIMNPTTINLFFLFSIMSNYFIYFYLGVMGFWGFGVMLKDVVLQALTSRHEFTKPCQMIFLKFVCHVDRNLSLTMMLDYLENKLLFKLLESKI